MDDIKAKYRALQARRKQGQSLEEVLKSDIQNDSFPPSPVPNIKTNSVAFAVIDPDKFINGYFDMTG